MLFKNSHQLWRHLLFLVVPSGPPSNVSLKSRGKHSLEVSWNAPRDQRWNGEQKKYAVCYSFYEKSSNPPCHRLTSSNPFILDGLYSATKYFVTVSTNKIFCNRFDCYIWWSTLAYWTKECGSQPNNKWR